eukprot:755653-Heterocapsa_arctica.AAC.1
MEKEKTQYSRNSHYYRFGEETTPQTHDFDVPGDLAQMSRGDVWSRKHFTVEEHDSWKEQI